MSVNRFSILGTRQQLLHRGPALGVFDPFAGLSEAQKACGG
jgi:hypothetical protein